jgi:hypothetical protein
MKTVVLLPTGDLISIRPRADVIKHKRETDSQYQIRLKGVLHIDTESGRDNKEFLDSAKRSSKAFSDYGSPDERNVSPSRTLSSSALSVPGYPTSDTYNNPHSNEWCNSTALNDTKEHNNSSKRSEKRGKINLFNKTDSIIDLVELGNNGTHAVLTPFNGDRDEDDSNTASLGVKHGDGPLGI